MALAAGGFRTWRKFPLCRDSFRRNFGKNLKWETNLDSALSKLKESKKPGMIVCHKSWCGACRALKPKFENSKDIETLSSGFVLISLEDENLPKEQKYMPDGDYVPRVLFVSPKGLLMLDITNEYGTQEYKYFYSEPEDIAKSMKRVLRLFSGK